MSEQGRVQSVVFYKDKFKLQEARRLLKKMGYVDKGVDIKPSLYRFRQFKPTYNNTGFINQKSKKYKGVMFVIQYKTN